VRGLLKEYRFLPEYFANIDGDFQFLSRKYRIHDRNIGCSQIRRDGKDQNAGISRSRSLVDQASGRWMSQTVDEA
jgi:hypothetical protein